MGQKVRANGVELWYELSGKTGSVVVMISGAASQATSWPEELISPLIDDGFRVLTFDRRDIGLSEWIDFQSHPYTADDEADDVVALLDAVGIDRAHVVGTSGGGIIAQLVALNHPDRVLSLTSWMASPDPLNPELPQMGQEIMDTVLSPAKSRDERIEQRFQMLKAFSGSRYPFDEKATRARIEADWARGQNPSCAHAQVGFAAPPRTERLKSLRIPTLVIHGDEDPALPLPHAELIASTVPHAHLVVLNGVGHEIPPGVCPMVVDELIAHLRSAGS